MGRVIVEYDYGTEGRKDSFAGRKEERGGINIELKIGGG